MCEFPPPLGLLVYCAYEELLIVTTWNEIKLFTLLLRKVPYICIASFKFLLPYKAYFWLLICLSSYISRIMIIFDVISLSPAKSIL